MDERLAVVLLLAGAFLALASSQSIRTSQYSYHETIEESRVIINPSTGEVSYQTDTEVISHSTETVIFNLPSLPDSNGYPHTAGNQRWSSMFWTDLRSAIHFTKWHPLCAIGELISSTGKGYCTVYMISSHHAVTSGHCVYNTTSKRSYVNLDVSIGRTCYQQGIRAKVRKVSLYRAYKQSGDTRYDIALLQLDSSQINSKCYLGLGYQKSTPTFTSYVCGYPYDKQRWYHLFHCMYCRNGTAHRLCKAVRGTTVCYDDYIAHTTDTTRGMNGGPLLMTNHPGISGFISYGVSGGRYKYPNGNTVNIAVAFTPKKLVDICAWLRVNGGICKMS